MSRPPPFGRTGRRSMFAAAARRADWPTINVCGRRPSGGLADDQCLRPPPFGRTGRLFAPEELPGIVFEVAKHFLKIVVQRLVHDEGTDCALPAFDVGDERLGVCSR